ncbi:MAG: hypothetical protein WCL11_07995, partial [Verrucomicrobiota bacterium]
MRTFNHYASRLTRQCSLAAAIICRTLACGMAFLLCVSVAGAAAPGVKETLLREVRRSRPDYVVFVPGSFDGSTHDGHNEHFLVFDSPDGSLMAIWTQ